jgi:hypothetical protein
MTNETTVAPIPFANAIPPDTMADAQAVANAVAAGRVVDPEIARRVRERADEARRALSSRGMRDIGVQLIRESRGPLDDDQACELTLIQRDLLRQGELRLTDPEMGKTYVLVAKDENDLLVGTSR